MIPEKDRSPITEEELRARWPGAFNDARLPLKIGINADLGIKHADSLANWVRHPRYLRNIIAGVKRIDLNGEQIDDEISEAEKTNAFETLLHVRSDIVTAQMDRRDYSSYVFATGLSVADEKAEARRGLPKGSAARMRGEIPRSGGKA
jgi:sRNA-binding protein